MGRNTEDLERLTETWAQIADGQIGADPVSYREAVRILTDRLAALVHPGEARRPYVTAMVRQGYRRATAYKVVNRAFARAAERIAVTVRTGAGTHPETLPKSGPIGTTTSSPADTAKTARSALPVVDTAPLPERGSTRALLRADPLYYCKSGQPALGATPWRYFRDNPKLPLYAPAAYPMTDVGVPVLDPLNWVAPYGVDETGTPLAPYGVTHRFGYPVRREGVPPGSPLPSPKTHATGEEGWEDW